MSFAKIDSTAMAGPTWGRPLIVLWLCLFFFLGLSRPVSAQTAAIQLTKFPDAVLADGVSTVTISVQVRNRNGSNVPDGTQVLFETTLGAVRPNLVETKNGFAQATLTSDAIAGIAKVTASVLSFRATSTIEVKFAATKEELSDEQFVATLSAPNRLTYSPEKRIMRADGPGLKAHLRGPGFDLYADDLQYDVRSNQVLTRKSRLVMNQQQFEFTQLRFDVRERTGSGFARIPVTIPLVSPKAPYFTIEMVQRDRLTLVQLTSEGISPLAQPAGDFTFTPIDEDITLVYAKQATIYPAREVQFRMATVDIQGSKVLRGVPLFKVSTQSVRPVLTEEFVRMADNQFNVDFPYYTSLSATESSNFRFRYGTLYSRGFGATGGMYLDFERNWSFSGDQKGYFAFQGIGRRDWGITARQSLHLWQNANAYLQADLPANRAIVANLNADSRVGTNARATYNAGFNRNIKGERYESFDQTLALRRDPQRIGKSPVSANFGVFGSTRQFKTFDSSFESQAFGADLQLLVSPQRLGQTTLSTSARVSQLWGSNVNRGLTSSLTTSLSGGLGRSGSFNLTYDFSDDRFSSETVGRHRLAADFSLDMGRFYLFSFLSKSLDVDRYNIQGDLSYRLSARWRIGATTTIESFRGSAYDDTGVVVAYNLGLREVGLSWSTRRKRIGIEILGSPIR